MKKILLFVTIFGIILSSIQIANAKSNKLPYSQKPTYKTANNVYVKWYRKKNGKYVQGYYRTKKDNSISNNYSSIYKAKSKVKIKKRNKKR